MNDDEPTRSQSPVSPGNPERVRFVDAGDAAGDDERDGLERPRRGDRARRGDRSAPPPSDRPEPVMRFPRPRHSGSSTSGGFATGDDLPYWDEPPTTASPRYSREDEPAWPDDDLDDRGYVEGFSNDESRFADPQDRAWSQPDEAFDDAEHPEAAAGAKRSVFAEHRPDDGRSDAIAFDDTMEDVDARDDTGAGEGRRTAAVSPRGRRLRRWRRQSSSGESGEVDAPREALDPGDATERTERKKPERDVRTAVGVGAALGAVALLLFGLGPAAAMFLVLPVTAFAAAELLTALRQAGYRPAVAVGVVAVVAMVLASYHEGPTAIGLVLFLSLVTTMLWWLFGIGTDQPLINISATLLAVVWIGVCGSYAALLLAVDAGELGRPGVGILLGAILCTVGSDVGAWLVGRNLGRSPLAAVSPNKSWEGLIGGFVAAVAIGVAYAMFVEPFDGVVDGLLLGVAVGLAAPFGDLCQSLVKRDVGLKDMGTVLPGHGGVFDRFDALLFVLPVVYYVARMESFFL